MSSSTVQFDIDKVRSDFPNLAVEINGHPLVYLDNGATTLKPQCVIDAVCHHYSAETANVHRGVHTLSERATSAYEGARERIQSFINAPALEEIIFTSGTTDAINLVAQCYGRRFVEEGDEILITEMEHHSNIVPWQMLCEERGCVLKVVPFNDRGELCLETFQKLLNERTRLVSVVYVSNSLGTINPVEKIIELAHARQVPVLLDAAQAVSYFPIDVQKLNCDFLAFSGHKLFGPTGTGVLYGKAKWLNEMPPYRGGGDMIRSVTFDKTVYNTLPYKFEAGTPNIAGFIGLGRAVQYVQDLGLANTHAHRADVLAYATAELSKIDGIRIIGTAQSKTAILSFIHEDVHAHDMGTLVDEEGVAIRTGHHCTQPVMDHFGISATSRASFSIYNTRDDVDRFVRAVQKSIELFR